MRHRNYLLLTLAAALLLGYAPGALAYPGSYAVVDTGQTRSYNNRREIVFPAPGVNFHGQDAQYSGNQPSYRDNLDGTATDLNTGLTWTQDPGTKKSFTQALAGAYGLRTGGHDDWRLPTIKELYSLIIFSGTDPDPGATAASALKPFIDIRYFKFKYGDPRVGERIIDSQYASSTKYVSTTGNGVESVFGVNFADGRIKGYGIRARRGPGGPGGPGSNKKFYVLYVRGNPDYGKNDFIDNPDATVTDRATGLVWLRDDSSMPMNWQAALRWCESLAHAGQTDWRLPNAKELQSIVDYSRSPDTTGTAAIDPVFRTSEIVNEGEVRDFPGYWSSTTHAGAHRAQGAAYISFGRSLGWVTDRKTGNVRLLDVHGAGSQRSDPKNGDPSDYAKGRGPQGDVVRINNYVRCVRGGEANREMRGPRVLMPVEPVPGPRRTGQGAPGEGQATTAAPAVPAVPRGITGEFKGHFINRLDSDGDGKVSRSEFDGPQEHFGRLDKNSDGFISMDEAPTSPPQGMRMR